MFDYLVRLSQESLLRAAIWLVSSPNLVPSQAVQVVFEVVTSWRAESEIPPREVLTQLVTACQGGSHGSPYSCHCFSLELSELSGDILSCFCFVTLV